MRMLTLLMLFGLVLMTLGCEPTETQKSAGLGALVGGLAGSLAGDADDRGRNALIGGAVGAAAGGIYGQHKTKLRLEEENRQLRKELEMREIKEELRRLQEENERLRQSANPSGKKFGTGTAHTL